jgi:hypothetical protein
MRRHPGLLRISHRTSFIAVSVDPSLCIYQTVHPPSPRLRRRWFADEISPNPMHNYFHVRCINGVRCANHLIVKYVVVVNELKAVHAPATTACIICTDIIKLNACILGASHAAVGISENQLEVYEIVIETRRLPDLLFIGHAHIAGKCKDVCG